VKETFVSFFLLMVLTGCNRQDTDALSRMGRKINARARSTADEVSSKLDLPWPTAPKEPSLQEKVHDRLRWDSTLNGSKLEVRVNEKEVELRGTVRSPQQKQRAVELAETVLGVEKVRESIEVSEGDPPVTTPP
jgi:osmotically-inducible protein OsmY